MSQLPPLADSIANLAETLLPQLRVSEPSMLASAAIRAIGQEAARDIALRIKPDELVCLTASVLRKNGSEHHAMLEAVLASPRDLKAVEERLRDVLRLVRAQTNRPELRVLQGGLRA